MDYTVQENPRVEGPEQGSLGNEPIEPGKAKFTKLNIFKWVVFLFVAIYALVTLFHAPILKRLGEYLIVEHTPVKSDLILCLAGGNIERGLATADAYNDGLAPLVFVTRGKLPDGYELLKEKGLEYPEEVDLLIKLLTSAGVPKPSILTDSTQVDSTLDEARLLKKVVDQRHIKSLIIITSPTHTRRTWLTFREILKDSDVRILMLPSKYSEFDPDGWWKNRTYVRQVIIEYQKLIFYIVKYGV